VTELRLVAGVARTGAIGDGDTIPWHYDEDEQQYKDRVADHPVIVGRKTHMGMTRVRGTHPVVVTSTPEEYAAWLAAWGAEGHEEAFQRLDRGDKGFLTEEDLIVAVHEFYLSEDPNAPGNVLYGTLS